MNTPALLPELKTHPAVFSVKDQYQIMVPVKSDVLFWVTVDGEDYYDHSNGIIRSSTRMHRVNVPMEVLDRTGSYTIHYRKIIERKPYFPTTEEPVSADYRFFPVVPGKPIRIYHLADTHGKFEYPSSAAKYFGDSIDLLILNGDIPDHSGDIKHFDLIYELCSAVTGGSKPCIFSRGNHDTRGFYAENIADYTPTENGHSYFTFRLGPIWGIVMDCGEDKPDTNPEYGNTICCHQFRLEETRYLEQVIRHARDEYLAEGVQYRLVIAHNPFTNTLEPPFDIEQDLFKKWVDLLGEHVKPQALISGHLHRTLVCHPGGELDDKGQTCPVIVGSDILRDQDRNYVGYVGAAITLDNLSMTVAFTNQDRQVLQEETFPVIA